jgi:hypothetical protein
MLIRCFVLILIFVFCNSTRGLCIEDYSSIDVPMELAKANAEAQASFDQIYSPAPNSIASVPSSPQKPIQEKAPQTHLTKTHTFNVGLEGSHISYREPAINVEDEGVMGGFYGEYYFRPEQWDHPVLNVFHLDAHVDYGKVNYKSDDGKANGIDDYILESRIWLGRDFNLLRSTDITPYVGIGYRYLFDNFGKVDGGYDRLSQYVYVPVGFELTTQIPGWQFSFKPEYDIFVKGWQTSYLSKEEGFPDITNPQKKGYGLRASLDILKKCNDVNYVVSPYIRFWHIKDSEIRTANGGLYSVEGQEPENKSTEIGVKFGVQF